jgi:uncharacterized protein (TIGR00725 family)
VRRTQIAVVGSGPEHEGPAEEAGRLIARAGCTLVCGGLGEVMAAAARGAKEAGGTTVGIVPGEARGAANEWIDHEIVTGIGHARNLAVVASADAVVAVGGRWGTLAEIALARTLGRPVVVVDPGWGITGDGIDRAGSAAAAVQRAVALARRP